MAEAGDFPDGGGGYDYDEGGDYGDDGYYDNAPKGWVPGDTHHVPEGSKFECKCQVKLSSNNDNVELSSAVMAVQLVGL